MDIREIRVDRFEYWEDVVIPNLDSGVNVVHLDDGARGLDLSRFIHGVIYGFEARRGKSSAGCIVFDDHGSQLQLSRAVDVHGKEAWAIESEERLSPFKALARIQSDVDARQASDLFIPVEEVGHADNWLKSLSGFADQVFPRDVKDESFNNCDTKTLEAFQNQLRRLARDRMNVLEGLLLWNQESDALPIKDAKPQANDSLIADLKDEIRTLQRQMGPLQDAVNLADQWYELESLRSHDFQKATRFKQWNRWFRQYGELADEKSQLHKEKTAPAETGRRKESTERRERLKTEAELRRLLEKRDWVIAEQARFRSAEEARAPLVNAIDQVRRAFERLDAAERVYRIARQRVHECQEARRRSADKKTIDDAMDDSSKRGPTPEQILTELKRRRVWIREEHRCLGRRHEALPQTLLWLLILASFSFGSIFATLLVASVTTQWFLFSLGVAGIVSSGALKLAIELRLAKALVRCKKRLRNLDLEIAKLKKKIARVGQGDAVSNEEQALGTLESESLAAQRVLESRKSDLESFLESLDLTANLTRDEAISQLRDRDKAKGAHGHRRLDRWRERARTFIESVGKQSPASLDAEELLRELERVEKHFRKTQKVEVLPESAGKRRRYALRQIEKRQASILKQAGVRDRFDLESEFKAVEALHQRHRRMLKLRRQVSAEMELASDVDEVRELLQTFSAATLKMRLSEKRLLLEESEQALSLATESSHDSTPNSTSNGTAEEHRQRLLSIETKMKSLVNQRQTAESQNDLKKDAAQNKLARLQLADLRELTRGKWSSVSFGDDGLVVYGDAGEERVTSSLPEYANIRFAIQLVLLDHQMRRDVGLPLVLNAETLVSESSSPKIERLLKMRHHRGQQIILLTTRATLAADFARHGFPCVRVGLHELPGSRRPPTLLRAS